jgi:hypothetical protein
MSADGLDVAGVARDRERSMGLYLIELDGVERSFHYWRESSAARRLADDPAALAEALRGAGLIHLSGISLAILPAGARETLFRALAEARSSGAVVSFDPNVRARLWSSEAEIRETIGRMLALADVALPSFDDEAAVRRARGGREDRGLELAGPCRRARRGVRDAAGGRDPRHDRRRRRLQCRLPFGTPDRADTARGGRSRAEPLRAGDQEPRRPRAEGGGPGPRAQPARLTRTRRAYRLTI